MALEARKALIESRTDNRGRVRKSLHLELGVEGPRSLATPATIHNISETGLLLETGSGLEPGERIDVNLPHAGFRTATVMWASERLVGCQFDDILSTAALSAARLRGSFTSLSPGRLPALVEEDPQEELGVPAPDELPTRAKAGIITALALLSWAFVIGIALALL
jgi:hypothetical protein